MADWNTVRYDPNWEEKLDPEIIPLCDALNAAGFATTTSCCGHGHRWPLVVFEHSTDERIERLARFVMERELGDYRSYSSMWQKEILPEGYAWSLHLRLNNVYSDTPASVGLEEAKSAMRAVTEAIEAWRALLP
jgi:hypothetical protein